MTRHYSELGTAPEAKKSENERTIKGILEGAIKQVDMLKSLAKLGYNFSSLICMPVEKASGLEDILYEWKNFS